MARRRGHLIPRALPAWYILIPGLICLFLIVPNGVGQGLGLDYRLPPLVFLVAGLFVRLDWRDQEIQLACFAVLLTLSLARSASFTLDATANAKVFRAFATAAHEIPSGSRLLSGVGTPRSAISWDAFWRPPAEYAEYMGTQAIEDHFAVPSVFALRSRHTLLLREDLRDLNRQFDVSSLPGVDEMRDVARTICPDWHRAGHAGSAFLVVVYPSVFSANAFPPPARLAAGTGFQLVDLCVSD